jgi:hypothetical protein
LFQTAFQHVDDSVNDLPSYICIQHSNFTQHQAGAGGEEFSGSSKTRNSKLSLTKGLIRDADHVWIAVGVTGHLAQNPVSALGIG